MNLFELGKITQGTVDILAKNFVISGIWLLANPSEKKVNATNNAIKAIILLRIRCNKKSLFKKMLLQVL